MNRSVPRNAQTLRRGLTLVEVIVAASVILLAFVSAISAVQAGFRMIDDARMATLATQLLQSQTENLRLLHWGFIGGSPGTPNTTWYFQSKPFSTGTATSPGNLASQSQPIDFRQQIPNVVGNVDTNQLARIHKFELHITNSNDPTGSSRPNCKLIRSRVEWFSLDRKRLYTRELVTYYSEGGINDFYYSGQHR